jgi:hypothetical protein
MAPRTMTPRTMTARMLTARMLTARTLILALAGLAVASPAAAVPLPQTAAPVSEAEMAKLFTGRTFLTPSMDAFIAPGGSTKGVVGKPRITGTFTGRWAITGNEFCMTTTAQGQSAEAQDCIKVWRDGPRLYSLYSSRSDGIAVDDKQGYLPYGPRTRTGDVVTGRYTKAGGQ